MFAGQYAADVDAQLQYFVSERFRVLEFARDVGVVEDQRMKVAVAGMEYVRDPQVMLGRKLAHSAQHTRQLAPRDRAVHAVVVGADAADGRKRGLASGPEREPLGLAGRGSAPDRALFRRKHTDTLDEVVNLFRRTIEFDDQDRLDIERV